MVIRRDWSLHFRQYLLPSDLPCCTLTQQSNTALDPLWNPLGCVQNKFHPGSSSSFESPAMLLKHSSGRILVDPSRHTAVPAVPRHCASSSSSSRSRLLLVTHAAEGSGGDVLADIKRVAKKIQGSLPIVGLLSRLSAPGGGFDEISYPEFCRSTFDTASQPVMEAVVEMERRYGKLGQTRWLYCMLWMAKHGNGLVPPKNIYLSAKRLRVTQDVEIEMDRFENARDATLAKYRMMQRPKGKLADGLNLAVDGIATLCMGLADGQAVPEADEEILSAVIGFVFPEASTDELISSIRSRPQRVSAYT